MMSSYILLFFSISILLLIASNIYQFKINLKLNKEISKLSKKIEYGESLFDIDVGDKVIFTQLLVTKSLATPVKFSVDYEAEVIEVGESKLKVRAVSFQSDGSEYPSDPKNQQGIMSFMQNKWISRSGVEPIIDDSKRREKKIKNILE